MSRSLGVLTQERLLEMVEYDPASGEFVWRINRGGNARAGQVAGTVNSEGYIAIHIEGRTYKGHRLAFFYVHGRWPLEEIDHINRVKTDNRLSNLREATRLENATNTLVGKSGLRGAYFEPRTGRYFAQIKVKGKNRNLGTFASAEEAHEAFKVAHIDLYGPNSEYYREAA